MIAKKPLRPLLRWAGSKRKLLPQLSNYWSATNRRYIEPFFGSGALYFSLCPARAILSDLNSELVDMYKTLREDPEGVYSYIEQMEPTKDNYLSWRSMVPANLQPMQRCARFIFLNRNCFNGLFRTNQAGQFNVPFSGQRTGSMPAKNEFLSIAKQLNDAAMICGDFEEIVLKNARKGDLVYLDPPYAQANVRIFSQYGPDVFGLDDLSRLKKMLHILDNKGIDFVLSYAFCEEAEDLFGCWSSEKIDVRRNIAGFAKHRKLVPEVIYTNKNMVGLECYGKTCHN